MRIVLGIDGSPESIAARELVTSRSWPAGTRLVLLGVLQPHADRSGRGPLPKGERLDAGDVTAGLELQAHPLRERGLHVEVDCATGDPAELLMARAREMHADLIVVGSRGRGPAASLVLGSVSTTLVDRAPCPVLVARGTCLTRMVLASDGTRSSRDIPRVLASWGAAFRGMPVEVVSVAGTATPDGARASRADRDDEDVALHERIADGVADELMDLGWHAAAIARCGKPGVEIVRAGEEWGADLIVTGSRGVGALHRLLAGSVAHDVVLHTRASVLVVRGLVPAEARRLVAVVGPATG